MSIPGPSDGSNPFSPSEGEPGPEAVDGRPSFHDFRQACLDHETFLRCLGLADILCASAGALVVANAGRILTAAVGRGFDWRSFLMIQWVVGSFVFLPVLALVLVKLGIELARRQLRAWRVQVLLSGIAILFLSVKYATSVVRDPRGWQSMAVEAVFAANALILWILLSKRGFRIISPRYATIVAVTPSLNRKLGVWAILGAVVLSAPLGLGLLGLVQWLSTQAAYLLEPVFNQ
jgi:hypothetical protein